MDGKIYSLEELKKKKKKTEHDPKKWSDHCENCYRLGHYYFEKGYYDNALVEYKEALRCFRAAETPNIQKANIHRFIAETYMKLGKDLLTAKDHLDSYHSISCKLNNTVEIQRAHITLGNYFMSLLEEHDPCERINNLNKAYEHYLQAYDLLDLIEEKRLMPTAEFALSKARICLNCAYVLDEKRDEAASNEYLKTAIQICESNQFYDDLIRCLYIKCERAKRLKRINECISYAEKIIYVTEKTYDHVQQSSDYLFVSDIYIEQDEYRKAKILLDKNYKLRKKCNVPKEVKKKLKHVNKIITLTNEIKNVMTNEKLVKIYEDFGDSYCSLKKYEKGLECYKKQLEIAKKLNKSNKELALIYSSIAQTYQDLDKYEDSLHYFNLEYKHVEGNSDLECKALLDIVEVKEKMKLSYKELNEIYEEALYKAQQSKDLELQLRVLSQLSALQEANSIDNSSVNEKLEEVKQLCKKSEKGSKVLEAFNLIEDEIAIKSDESVISSSESSIDSSSLSEAEDPSLRKAKFKRVKRNLRGETQLHVACIKGNFELVKELVENGHPVNERDNFKWLPIHEACNYGHLEIVKILLKHGAKYDDRDGPITPLQDASQNGHFDVVNELLNAGANPYVFDDDGFTPIDYLYKYKADNESSMTPEDLASYQRAFDTMLRKIKVREPQYKIKSIKKGEAASAVVYEETSSEATSHSATEQLEKVSWTRADLDEDRNPVYEYKDAIQSLGSKHGKIQVKSKYGHSKSSRQAVSAVVTEEEFVKNDKWLIDDIDKKNKQSDNARKSTSKRKFNSSSESLENHELENESNSKAKKHAQKSKKRFTVTEEDDNSNETNSMMMQCDNDNAQNNNMDFYFDENLFEQDTNSNPPKSNLETVSETLSDIYIADVDDDFEVIEHRRQANKASSHSNYLKNSTNERKILKNVNIKKAFGRLNSDVSNGMSVNKPKEVKQVDSFKIFEECKQSKPVTKQQVESKSSSNKLKLKVLIDNKSLLIPVSDSDIIIDELIEQIISRYKLLFGEEQGFREPQKVILKNSDGDILFGRDLLNDVLGDIPQVSVIVEKWKEEAKIWEVYDKHCKDRNLALNDKVYDRLKKSDETKKLDFNLCFLMTAEIKIIFMSSVQYLQSIYMIDFSDNQLVDEFSCSFFDVFHNMHNLTHLKLSRNAFTIKTLDYFVSGIEKAQSLGPVPKIETLCLSENDFSDYSSKEAFEKLAVILQKLKLKTLELAYCDLDLSTESSKSSVNNFLSELKNSSIKDFDISYNKFSVNNFVNMLEALQMPYRAPIISLNLARCIKVTESCMQCLLQIIEKFHDDIECLNLACLNINKESCDKIFKQMSDCKNLLSFDVSYNNFSFDMIGNLLDECLRLEKLNIVTRNGLPSIDSDFFRKVENKVNSDIPLKELSFRYENDEQFCFIKNVFSKKFSTNWRYQILGLNCVKLYNID